MFWNKLTAALMPDLITVTFHMKSGNQIVADRVVRGFIIESRGDAIIGIKEWFQDSPKNKLMVSTIALSQIEAITHS